MEELKKIIESAPVPQFHLNNELDQMCLQSSNLRELVEEIARLNYDLEDDHVFEELRKSNPHYQHYVQTGPDRGIEYFKMEVKSEDKRINGLLEQYFGEQINVPIEMNHLESIPISALYVTGLENGAIEYAGVGVPWDTDSGKTVHIIFGHISKGARKDMQPS